MLKRRFIYILLFVLAMPLLSLADLGPLTRTIQWYPLSKVRITDTRSVSELTFTGARYELETASLPVYKERFSIASVNNEVEAVLSNQVWEEMSENIQSLEGVEMISGSLEIRTGVAVERKKAFATVSFVPLRKNPANGRIEKLVSFTISIRLKQKSAAFSGPSRAFKQNSVLASGNWYKVAVQQTGVYKITYDDLSALGMNPASINPQNLSVYGNGGGMLPEPCDEPRYDDLMENAILVSGEGDGSFDQGDYILFYAESPHTWTWDEVTQRFDHKVNIYSDFNYYFITASPGPGKRITDQSSVTEEATHTVTSFTDRKFIEEDDLNIVRTGRDWFESPSYEIQTSAEYSFNFPNIVTSSPVKMSTRVAARSSSPSLFRYYTSGNQLVETVTVQAVNFSSDTYASISSSETEFNAGNAAITLKVTYSKPLSNSIGWMDYIALNARRNLSFSGGQVAFRDPESAGPGNIAEYRLTNASQDLVIWNVSDPMNIKKVGTSLNGTQMSFRLPADEVLEFISFNGSSFYSPQIIGKIENQNLHGLSTPDLVIISYSSFLNEASRLAQHHRNYDGMDVVSVDVEQVYNEFSSGGQDITAIRDFMKMLYDEAQPGEECRYLLLFGDASYDYKDRIENNNNYVPTWEDSRSMNLISSIATDDYYGFLDDNEGGGGPNNLLDLGIGRYVVSSQEMARNMVNKTLHYITGGEDVYGSWRNVVCFVADDEDNNLHISQAEQMAVRLDTDYGDINVDKIYLDAYPQESTSGGQRAPAVNNAINARMDKGSMVMNYTGHGGEAGWAHERILGIPDVNAWTNYDHLPIFITATCEFSRYDDPTRVSAGELVLLNANGGAVGLFTTARATYGSPNFEINNAMYDQMFEKTNGEYPRFGDLISYAKNKSGGVGDNDRKFILLGDPAMQLAYPKNKVNTIKINGISIENQNDTLKALQKVTISGSVLDENGLLLESYNGTLRPTVYDKQTRIETLVSDPESKPFSFDLLLAILFKGKANIVNGEFSFSFIVPKDIAYSYGYGKISYYANNTESDASGHFKEVVIGGYDENVPKDEQGPEIQLYLNDENFGYGGVTDENPLLLAFVSDSSGINTVGTGIGHDIVTTLDNDNNKSVIINDYYESDIDSYSSGVIKYPFTQLSEGNHSLSIKVWDVHNNSSEAYTEFVVATSAELAIDHVLNYPNPFTTSTAFYFDHNQPNSMMEVQVQIFTVSGRLVKTLDQYIMTDGYRSEPIYWDGLDDYGDKIGRGVYIYKVRVSTQDGSFVEALEKLVILR